MRLQVFLSHNGLCSRRKAMEIIQSGCVKVNREIVTEPSTPVDPSRDKIFVDGKPIEEKLYQYVVLNKPAGYVTTTTDPHAEKTVLSLLPKEFQHLNPVGRLDKDTQGLLLFTNDGDAAYRLTHPKFNVDKTYVVKIHGELTPEQKILLEKGVPVEDKRTAPAKIRNLRNIGAGGSEFEITIHEGRKRQIRHMLNSVGHKVIFLKRIVQGPLLLGDLKTGQWRILNKTEINAIERPKTVDHRQKTY